MNKPSIIAAVGAIAMSAALLVANPAGADQDELRATLRDPVGRVVGSVQFSIDKDDDGQMRVGAVLRPNTYVTPGQFHGFHVHANGDPINGAGCVASASQPSTTWFVSADGHLAESGTAHGDHVGDMPSPLVQADGTALLVFHTDRVDPKMLAGRAVVLHAGRDNYNNVPTGPAPDQYTPNSSAATAKSTATGNAGDRVACGLIRWDD